MVSVSSRGVVVVKSNGTRSKADVVVFFLFCTTFPHLNAGENQPILPFSTIASMVIPVPTAVPWPKNVVVLVANATTPMAPSGTLDFR